MAKEYPDKHLACNREERDVSLTESRGKFFYGFVASSHIKDGPPPEGKGFRHA